MVVCRVPSTYECMCVRLELRSSFGRQRVAYRPSTDLAQVIIACSTYCPNMLRESKFLVLYPGHASMQRRRNLENGAASYERHTPNLHVFKKKLRVYLLSLDNPLQV